MATNQQVIQNLVQNVSGTHTAGQANVPSAGQSGNPNTAYNWTTYLPKPTPSGRINFQLLASQAPASSPGYTTPFTADPYAAAVLAGMPKAQGNDFVNNMLNRMFSGPPAGGWPIGGGGGGGGGGTTPPDNGGGTPPPTTPYTPPPHVPSPALDPIGPISGPIARDPLNQAGNYQNAMPNTSLFESGLGRDAVNYMWMPTSPQQGTLGSTNTSNAFTNALKSMASKLGSEAQQFLDNLTMKNGWAGLAQEVVGFLGAAMGIPGASMLLQQIADKINKDVQAGLIDMSEAEKGMQEQTAALMNQLMSSTAGAASDKMINDFIASQQAKLDPNSQQGSDFDLEAWYNSQPQMSKREWDNLIKQLNFNAMFYNQEATQNALDELNAKSEFIQELFKRNGEVYK